MKNYFVFQNEEQIIDELKLKYNIENLPDGKTLFLTPLDDKKLDNFINLNELILKLKEKKNEDGNKYYKDITIKTYERLNIKLLDLIYAQEWIDRNKLPLIYYKDYEKIINYINNTNNLSLNEKKCIINAFIIFYKEIFTYNKNDIVLEKYEKLFNYLCEKQNIIRLNRQPTENEIKNKTSKKEIKDELDLYLKYFKLDEPYSNEDIKLLLLALYYYMPPIRQHEYINCLVNGLSDDKNDNYIDWTNNKFIINNHKTQRIYKGKNLDIPLELMEIIKKIINKIPNADYLLCKKDGTKNTSSNISHIFASIFSNNDKTITNNIVRKSIISETLLNCDIDTQINLANACSHNSNTQFRDYAIYNRKQ